MKQQDLIYALADNLDIQDPKTIVFYHGEDGPNNETFISLCDLSVDIDGEEVVCVDCYGLDSEGDPVYFEASEFLVKGPLGRLVGAQ